MCIIYCSLTIKRCLIVFRHNVVSRWFKPSPANECFIIREFKYYASNLKNRLWLNIAQQWKKHNKSSCTEHDNKRGLMYLSEHCGFMNYGIWMCQ